MTLFRKEFMPRLSPKRVTSRSRYYFFGLFQLIHHIVWVPLDDSRCCVPIPGVSQVDYAPEFTHVMSCVVDVATQYCALDGVKERDDWCNSKLEVG